MLVHSGGNFRPYPLKRDFRLAAALQGKLPGHPERHRMQRKRPLTVNLSDTWKGLQPLGQVADHLA